MIARTTPDRLRDLADVQDLARVLKLDERLAPQLHSYVRDKFVELVRPLAASPDSSALPPPDAIE